MADVTDIKKSAVERSIFDLDRMIEEGLEMFALGRHDAASECFLKVLEALEERFRGGSKNIPVDVVVRKLKCYTALGKTCLEEDKIDASMKAHDEALALANGPLVEFPELLAQASIGLASARLKAKDLNSAKKLITDAAKIPVKDNYKYCKALANECTGRLFMSFGKIDMAEQAVKGGLALMAAPEGREQVELRSALSITLAEISGAAGDRAAAASHYDNAISQLIEAAFKSLENTETMDAIYYLGTARKLILKSPASDENNIRHLDVLMWLGELMDVRGHWDLATEYYAGAAELIRRHKVESPIKNVLCHVGASSMCVQLKNYKKAMAEAHKAAEFGNKPGNEYGLGLALYQQGLIMCRQGDSDGGAKMFDKALEAVKERPDILEIRRLKARTHNQQAYICKQNLDYENAIRNIRITVELLQKEYPFDLALGEGYRILGEVYTSRQQSMQGERALKKALEIFEKNCASVQLANVYKSVGSHFLNAGDLDKATFFIDEGIKLLEKIGIDHDLPMLYSSKGKICLMRLQHKEAEALFKKDLEISEKTKNEHSIAYSYYHLGIVKRLLGRERLAGDDLKKSKALFESVKDETMLGYVNLEMAVCASLKKDVKTATDCCARAQDIFRKNKALYSQDLANLFTVRGKVLRDAGRMQMAQRCFEDALGNYEKLEIVNPELAETHYEFSQYWRAIKNREKATEHVGLAIDIADKLGLSERLQGYLRYLAEFNPEAVAKRRLEGVMDKSAVEKMTSASASGDSLVIEKKNLTLLFTDIRSFTTISETLSLDELSSFLNDFYKNVTRVIVENNGRVNKFIGDEVLAIFNLDGKHDDDHVEWAVRAGVRLVKTMEEVNEIREKKGEMKIGLGVGINTGEVLIGSFGAGLRQDYTAIGDNVNVAARLQAQAKGGEVMISQSVYEKVKDMATVEDKGEVSLKGKSKPFQVWKVLGLKD